MLGPVLWVCAGSEGWGRAQPLLSGPYGAPPNTLGSLLVWGLQKRPGVVSGSQDSAQPLRSTQPQCQRQTILLQGQAASQPGRLAQRGPARAFQAVNSMDRDLTSPFVVEVCSWEWETSEVPWTKQTDLFWPPVAPRSLSSCFDPQGSPPSQV